MSLLLDVVLVLMVAAMPLGWLASYLIATAGEDVRG